MLALVLGCAAPAPKKTSPQTWNQDQSQAQSASPATSQAAGVPGKPSVQTSKGRGCTVLQTKDDLNRCTLAAQSGDAQAAFILGNAYARGLRNPSTRLEIKPDHRTALFWHAEAFRLGNNASLRYLFEAYYYGIKIKPDQETAFIYLERAVNLKQHWAMLIKAAWSESKNPKAAWLIYQELAIEGNCHAQEKLAQFYLKGFIKPANYTMAYFWGLLADKSAFQQRSGYHKLFGPSSTGSSLCGHSDAMHQAKSRLSKEYYRMAENSVRAWQPGAAEPRLPAPPPSAAIKKSPKKKKPAKYAEQDKLLNLPGFKITHREVLWVPVALNQTTEFSKELKPTELFSMVNKSVWTVVAANTKKNLYKKRGLSLGSGVAISTNQIITNYHVVTGRPYLQVRKGDKKFSAKILYADKRTDRCVLLVQGELEAIKGVRSHKKLNVGEQVYTVGSPRGLENTLGQGLISGLRKDPSGLHLIQTNAQISKGSSGGGLFDRFGNLIGITTLKIKDAESLNFAISVEDYTR